MAEAILSPGVFQIESDQSVYSVSQQYIGAAIVGPTVLGVPFVPTYVTNYNQYKILFGETFKSGSYYQEYFTSLAAKEYFANGGRTLLVTRIVSGSSTNLTTYASASVTASNFGANSFTIETLAWGDVMNSVGPEVSGALASGSATNLRWEIPYSDTSSGLFSLVVRRGDDTTAQKNVLETWNNLSLDPQLPNYISRVIGDLKPIPNLSTGVLTYSGEFANKSAYIRVKSVDSIMSESIDNNGNFKTSAYGNFMPKITSGSFDGGTTDGADPKYMNETITKNNIQGFNTNLYTASFNILRDKDSYQFNVLLAPGISLGSDFSVVATSMINCVESRGDAIAILDSGVYGTSVADAVIYAGTQQSNYAATYYPWVQVYSQGLGKTVWVPPSTVIAGVLAFNDYAAAEWFAPAGLNRGNIPSVVTVERNVSLTDRDTLYAGRVNPIATFPGGVVAVWGNKTLQKKPSALDRINVRRLVIALKGYIGNVARTLVFEQNTTVTRNRFLAQVNPYLSTVVQRQGLYAYKVIMDDTNNTADVVDRNQLVGQIYIQPTKTAEYIIINFNILPTGATFPA